MSIIKYKAKKSKTGYLYKVRKLYMIWAKAFKNKEFAVNQAINRALKKRMVCAT
ncbi:hypothetical protein [Streptococcus hyointestinalis]|uniref:hypothetical protein n=1 Tax=Streptococcus hyointestinalis TaxID=1337 RepID=UPI003F98C255